MKNNNALKWAVAYGNAYRFIKYFSSREDAVAFSVEVNGALRQPLFMD